MHPQGGFSLIEMLIVVALFTIITGAALLNHGRFGESILATNLAYDIALSLREAQSYGISVRESPLGVGVFTIGYGVHFSAADSFIFFADRNGNRRYDGADVNGACVAGGASECLKAYRLERGNTIRSFCGMSALLGGSPECRNFLTGDTTLSFLDALFKRPTPDAFVRTNLNSQSETRYRSGAITIVSPRGREARTVEVFQTGQISIK